MTHRIVRLLILVACILGTGLALVSGCSLPLVTQAGRREFDPDRVVAGAKLVSHRTVDGVELRGIYLEADAESPLVLHLLPEGASATTGIGEFAGFGETLDELRRAGYSSLALDYRGVGSSDGEADSSAIAHDARAMWDEALARCGNRDDRIILRCASVGSLGAASVLETGARPKAAILAAPIDSATIAANWADEHYGGLLALAARTLARSPEVRALGPTLAEARLPVLVLLPTEDPFLDEQEQSALVGHASSLVRFELTGLSRQFLVLRFYGFESTAFEGELVGTLVPSEKRFLRSLE